MMDLLIRHGRLVDGTGHPWFWGDVGVRDGRIEALGRLGSTETRETIDATGLVVCPGFIDLHTHADIALLNDPAHDMRVAQGVTTVVFSNCGLGFAPATPEALTTLRETIGLIFGPDEHVSWDWTTVGSLLARYEQRGLGVNLAYLLAHGAVRLSVMGEADRAATAAERKAMAALVQQGMEEGAWGLSTGLWYTPMCFADLDEMVDLCRPVADNNGIFAIHLRDYGGDIRESIEEALTISDRSGAPVQISHLLANGAANKGRGQEYLSWLDEARRRGIDVTCDSYPYCAGSTLLLALLPQWAQAGGRAATLARLNDAATRRKIVAEMEASWADWSLAYLCGVRSEANKPLEGRRFTAIAAERGVSAEQFVVDLLREEELQVSFLIHAGHEGDVRTIMAHPAQMAGSDGLHLGGKTHPRLYGTFPRYLGEYVRKWGVLRLEEAIRKMTYAPARRLGLPDRGILREGARADLTLFDPDTIRDTATYGDPLRFPEGIPHVLVNGQWAKRDGQLTGELAGEVLRRA